MTIFQNCNCYWSVIKAVFYRVPNLNVICKCVKEWHSDDQTDRLTGHSGLLYNLWILSWKVYRRELHLAG